MKKVLLILALVLLLSSCSNSTPAISVGSTEISENAFYSELLNYKRDFLFGYLGVSEDSAAIWTQDSPEGKNENVGEAVTRMAVEEMVQFAWVIEYAKDNGAKITDEDKKLIEEDLKKLKDSFESEEEFNSYLENLHLNDKELKEYIENTYYYDKGFEKLISEGGEYEVGEEQLKKYYEDNFFTVKHIFIDTLYGYDGNGNPVELTEMEKAGKYSRVQQIIDDLENGGNFDILTTFSEDGSHVTYPDGITFGMGLTSDFAYENAVAETKVGEYTYYESEGGIYIIKRQELSETDFNQYIDYIKSAVYAEVSEKIYSDHKDEVKVNYEVINGMDIKEIKIEN